MSAEEPAATSASVRSAAALVRLPLEADRVDTVAEVLNGWLEGTHALNTRMRAPEFDEIMPITPFSAPDVRRSGDE